MDIRHNSTQLKIRVVMIIKMQRRYAFRKVSVVIIGVISLCSMVDANRRFSVFRETKFQFGNIIATKGGITSVLACFQMCGDTCGYVQYTNDGTCVLYSQVLLLTEPATVKGQIQGYRKVS